MVFLLFYVFSILSFPAVVSVAAAADTYSASACRHYSVSTAAPEQHVEDGDSCANSANETNATNKPFLCARRISDSEAARQREWERLCREQEMAEEAAQREMEREAHERRRKEKEKFRGFLAEQQVSYDVGAENYPLKRF